MITRTARKLIFSIPRELANQRVATTCKEQEEYLDAAEIDPSKPFLELRIYVHNNLVKVHSQVCA
jgi:hypothetical protein